MRGLYVSIILTCGILAALMGKIDKIDQNLQDQISIVESRLRENHQIYFYVCTELKNLNLNPNEFANQLIRAFNESYYNKYAGGDVKGAMVWIQDQNPEIDAKHYDALSTLMKFVFDKHQTDMQLVFGLINSYQETKNILWIMFIVIALYGMYSIGQNYYILKK